MSRFRTEGEVVNFMLDYTGLLSTEYKVHHMGSMLPEGMYVTLKDPLNKWCPMVTDPFPSLICSPNGAIPVTSPV